MNEENPAIGEVRDNVAEHRFEIAIGDDLAVAEYRLKDGVIDFVHTFVPESARGKGIAGKLIKAALAQARERRLGVEAGCTAFAAYIKGHAETHDLLTPDARTSLGVPERPVAAIVHPFYESHRGAMEAAMRQRLELAEPMLRARTQLSDPEAIGAQVMDEFENVLTRMPYVGGAANRMSDFFMRLLGFVAIGRVLRRHGVPPSVIGDIERETYQAQLLAAPAAERLAAGRQFLSPGNQALLREQATTSATAAHRTMFPDDFVYDFVEPGPGDTFEFGIDYKACGFCKFAASHGDQEILPNICGLDFVAYAARGVHLERTQTLAGGATHCDFRFSRLGSDLDDTSPVVVQASALRRM